MDTTSVRKVITDSLNEGKRVDEVRRDLISQGLSTAGFIGLYNEIAQELGVEDLVTNEVETDISKEVPLAMPLTLNALLRAMVSPFVQSTRAIILSIFLITVTAVLVSFVPLAPTVYFSGQILLAAIVFSYIFAGLVIALCLFSLWYVIVRSQADVGMYSGWLWTRSHIFALLFLTLLTICVLFASTAALVVPGAFFLLCSSFTLCVLMRESQSGIVALLRSTDLFIQSPLKITCRLVLVVGVTLLVGIVMGIAIWIIEKQLQETLVYIFGLSITFVIVSVLYMGGVTFLYKDCASKQPLFDIYEYSLLKWIYRLLAFTGFAALLGLGWLYINYNNLPDINEIHDWARYEGAVPERNDLEVDRFADAILEGNLDTAFTAGSVYHNSVGYYEVICDEVVHESPIRCQSTETTYVLEVLLSSGMFYCRDHTGYKEIQPLPAPDRLGCR